MAYKNPQKNIECKQRVLKRNQKFRRRVKQLVFRLRGCIGTLTDPCKWQGIIPYVALQFDHRKDEVKKYNISEMDSHSIKTIKSEMKKCDIICAICHSIKTEQRRLGYEN